MSQILGTFCQATLGNLRGDRRLRLIQYIEHVVLFNRAAIRLSHPTSVGSVWQQLSLLFTPLFTRLVKGLLAGTNDEQCDV